MDIMKVLAMIFSGAPDKRRYAAKDAAIARGDEYYYDGHGRRRHTKTDEYCFFEVKNNKQFLVDKHGWVLEDLTQNKWDRDNAENLRKAKENGDYVYFYYCDYFPKYSKLLIKGTYDGKYYTRDHVCVCNFDYYQPLKYKANDLVKDEDCPMIIKYNDEWHTVKQEDFSEVYNLTWKISSAKGSMKSLSHLPGVVAKTKKDLEDCENKLNEVFSRCDRKGNV